MKYLPFILLFAALSFFSCQEEKDNAGSDNSQIDEYLAQYAPYDMHFDASGYSENDKKILQNLVEAAKYLDTIFWLQTSKYGLLLRDSLEKNASDPESNKLLTLIKRNAGPFEMLNDHAAFVGDMEYYAGDELYPRGMTAEEFDNYIAVLSEEEKNEFLYPYTVIREDGDGGYTAVRYNVEYRKYIDPIVKLLNETADLSENESFAKYLRLKAEALLTDNYFDADAAWIDMTGNKFDMVFGPFETYADGIKGIKAKYQAYIEIVDMEESRKLDVYTQYLQQLEENLPVAEEYKSPIKGLTAKFVIVQDIIRLGEAGVGYQAVASNLPNDPEVHEKKGTVKTFWKNMFKARFNAIIKPVSLRLIDDSQVQYLSDEGFFQFVLMHEICHAIGPRTVKLGVNKGKPVNEAVGPNYSPLEEAKADIAGMHSLIYLIEQGVLPKERENEYFVSYLGSLFRSIRFGLNQAHGKAAAISLNYFLENGGVKFNDESKKWSIDFDNFKQGVEKLCADLIILEGDGDAEKVTEFFNKWAKITPIMQSSLDSVNDVPVDVMPKYSITWE
jgi:hypothetical protein